MSTAPHPPEERQAREALEAFARLLEDERQAAVRADVDALVSIQEPKRAALEAVRTLGLSGAAVDALATRARHNVALMRHMLECMKGLVGLDEKDGATYAPDGSLNSRPGRTLGAL